MAAMLLAAAKKISAAGRSAARRSAEERLVDRTEGGRTAEGRSGLGIGCEVAPHAFKGLFNEVLRVAHAVVIFFGRLGGNRVVDVFATEH